MIPNSKIRIMVFGTFDILHKGHLDFFKQARKLSRKPYLIVSVARDTNVKKIKGRPARFGEKRRLLALKKIRLVDKAVLGALKNYIKHILAQNPDIIALGYDQKAYTKDLRALLAKRGLKVKVARLRPYHPKIYKSSLVKPA